MSDLYSLVGQTILAVYYDHGDYFQIYTDQDNLYQCYRTESASWHKGSKGPVWIAITGVQNLLYATVQDVKIWSEKEWESYHWRSKETVSITTDKGKFTIDISESNWKASDPDDESWSMIFSDTCLVRSGDEAKSYLRFIERCEITQDVENYSS